MVDYVESFLDRIVAVHWPSKKGILVVHMSGSESANSLTGYVDRVRLILPDGTALNPWTASPKLNTDHLVTTPNLPYWASDKGPGVMSGTLTGRGPGLIDLSAQDKDQFIFINLSKYQPVNGKFIVKFRQPQYSCIDNNVQWVVAWDTTGPAAGAGPPTNYQHGIVGHDGTTISAYDQIAANAAIAASGGGSLICGAIFVDAAAAEAFASAHGLSGLYFLTTMFINNTVTSAGISAHNIGAYKKGGFQFPPGYGDKDFHFPILTQPSGTSWEPGFFLEEDPNNWLLAPQGYLPGGVDPSGDFGFELNLDFGGGTFSNQQTDHTIKVDAKTLIITQG